MERISKIDGNFTVCMPASSYKVLYCKFISSSVIIISYQSSLINTNKAECHRAKISIEIGLVSRWEMAGAANERCRNSIRATEMQQNTLKINQKSKIVRILQISQKCIFFMKYSKFCGTCHGCEIMK